MTDDAVQVAERIVQLEWNAQNLMVDRTVQHDSNEYLKELQRGFAIVKSAEKIVKEAWSALNSEEP